jgi:DNA replication and repair protein RecF
MHLKELRVRNLRLLGDVNVDLTDGWNAFVGPNGAGKTSLLEAVFALSHGRSFRRGVRDVLSSLGSEGFSIFGVLARADGRAHRLGLARRGGRLEARVNGESSGVAGLVQHCAVVCFEPGSHELINGAAEERRRFLDWGVFHVEPDFLGSWRRYQRALRQRNSALRVGEGALAEPWEIEMAESGERLAGMRETYMGRLRRHLAPLLAEFLGELGDFSLSLSRGWPVEVGLAEALHSGRTRDQERGFTGRGPHRADWSVAFERAPRREHLSRGQEKLCALALVLAQATLYAEVGGERPILCLDDLASELDQHHQEQVLTLARAQGGQVLLTGTELPQALRQAPWPLHRFHVEHGSVRP